MSRILVIDDDEQLLQLMAITIKKAGHEISLAPNGAEALILLAEEEFDLVITDIVMPEKDGIEVIISMIKNKVHPAIIAISGGSQRLDRNQLLELARVMKVDMILPKPITQGRLLEAVETLLLARKKV